MALADLACREGYCNDEYGLATGLAQEYLPDDQGEIGPDNDTVMSPCPAGCRLRSVEERLVLLNELERTAVVS